MKLAVTHPYSWPEVRRGAERIIVETSRAMARRGHDVTVFSAGTTASRVTEEGVTTVRFRRRHDDPIRHERWFGWRVLPELVLGRFDAVHAMMPHDCVAAIRARRLTKHRVVYEELGSPYRDWWAGLPDRDARERVVRDVDVYGCMSRFSLDVLEREWHREGAWIPGGVRLDEFTPADEREPVPTILFAGAVAEPRKGLPTLLPALDIVRREHPDVRLWLSGEGDVAPFLAEAPPGVANHVEHLPIGDAKAQGERYGRAWCTTLPSEDDSFGMVTIESLASGTPIVVADHAAPQEVVSPGVGFVTKLKDPASLAEGLLAAFELAKDPATAERCRAAAARFDWDECLAPALEALYSRD